MEAITAQVRWIFAGMAAHTYLYRLYIGSISASPTACPLRRYGRAGAQNDRLSEAVVLSTGTPIPAQWTRRRRCRYRADFNPPRCVQRCAAHARHVPVRMPVYACLCMSVHSPARTRPTMPSLYSYGVYIVYIVMAYTIMDHIVYALGRRCHRYIAMAYTKFI